MISENGNNMYMPVAPAYGYGGNGGGMFGDQGYWWIILLLLVFGNGRGFGNGFGGGNGGFGGFYPYYNAGNDVQRGFDQNAVITGITGVQNAVTSGFSDVQTALCNGFAGVNAGVANGFAQSEISNNARQIANMQQAFTSQMATQQGFNGVGSGIADLKYTVATENCADRSAISDGIRDVMENCNRNHQAILDKLCSLELDGVKSQLAQAQRENVGLQNQINMANLAASQTAQTGNIRDAIIGELRSCPIPAQPVYGNQPIFTCPQSAMPGCGCGGFAA